MAIISTTASARLNVRRAFWVSFVACEALGLYAAFELTPLPKDGATRILFMRLARRRVGATEHSRNRSSTLDRTK